MASYKKSETYTASYGYKFKLIGIPYRFKAWAETNFGNNWVNHPTLIKTYSHEQLKKTNLI